MDLENCVLVLDRSVQTTVETSANGLNTEQLEGLYVVTSSGKVVTFKEASGGSLPAFMLFSDLDGWATLAGYRTTLHVHDVHRSQVVLQHAFEQARYLAAGNKHTFCEFIWRWGPDSTVQALRFPIKLGAIKTLALEAEAQNLIDEDHPLAALMVNVLPKQLFLDFAAFQRGAIDLAKLATPRNLMYLRAIADNECEAVLKLDAQPGMYGLTQWAIRIAKSPLSMIRLDIPEVYRDLWFDHDNQVLSVWDKMSLMLVPFAIHLERVLDC